MGNSRSGVIAVAAILGLLVAGGGSNVAQATTSHAFIDSYSADSLVHEAGPAAIGSETAPLPEGVSEG